MRDLAVEMVKLIQLKWHLTEEWEKAETSLTNLTAKKISVTSLREMKNNEEEGGFEKKKSLSSQCLHHLSTN